MTLSEDAMTLQIICAWRGKAMGIKDGQGQDGVTHGLCDECFEKEWAKVKGAANEWKKLEIER